MPACPSRKRVLPLLAGAVLSAAVSGCAQYEAAEACTDLSSMVWPWKWLEDPTTVVTPVVTPLDTPLYRTEIVQVTGLLRDDDLGAEPVPASFQCVQRGDLLQSFGWTEPNALARPELRLERGPVLPAAAR
ncbi:hypothetical protein [Arenibaculum sp.]|jgi:hypothetical protein|uniref:hypothetical protein n=1 Tax=Arenibaculum sp. TaxID=2865862 RepID=UPI002E0FD8EA|nr:hypothetical protein [Arenibaculum sp.]